MREHFDVADIPRTPLDLNRGASFCTHILRESPGMLVFEPTHFTQLFWMIFMFFGALAAAGSFVVPFGSLGTESLFAALFTLSIGVTFAYVGYRGLGGSRATREIDLRLRSVKLPSKGKSLGECTTIDLRDIVALQVVRKRIESSENDYLSYELNLVLGDKRRVNLVDHGDEKQIMEDGAKIARALSCPLIKD